MKRYTLFLIALPLSFPLSVNAGAGSVAGAFASIKNVNEYLADQAAEEAVPDPVELDEAGQESLRELQAWARANPAAFAALAGEPEEESVDEEEAEDDETADASLYCADPNDPAHLWDAKAKKKKGKYSSSGKKGGKSKGKGKGRGKGKRGKGKKTGPVCTADKLKTNISICCLLFVRTRIGLPPNPNSEHAKDYGPVLLQNGYCQTSSKDARAAKKGSVILYDGGKSGHVDYVAEIGRYFFGPTNSTPASEWKSVKRVVKGIYQKCAGSK